MKLFLFGRYMELAGLKVRMADHSNRVHRKLVSAYGLLINCELQLHIWLLAITAKAPGSSTDGHANLEGNMYVCKPVIAMYSCMDSGYHSKKADMAFMAWHGMVGLKSH